MDLLFRVVIFVPVLFLVAVVVVAQQHSTAQETVKAASKRAARWLVWTAALLLAMTLLELLFIGF
jgi:hypothetical protein